MRLMAAALMVLLCLTMQAQEFAIRSLKAIRALTTAQVGERLPVAFEATVTYYDNSAGTDLFVQDDGVAIYVYAKPGAGFLPGDRVFVRGRTHLDFRPDVVSDAVTLLRHGPAPRATATTFARLIRGDLDCMRVAVRAQVRSADLVIAQKERSVYLSLKMENGLINAMVVGENGATLHPLLDSTVEITGVVAAKLDSKMQLTGILIEVPAISDVRILKKARASPESLPLTPMAEVLRAYKVQDDSRRVRIRGSLTYYQPGAAAVLQNGAESLWINTQYEGPLHIGQVVDASGFPDARNGYLTLNNSEINATPWYANVMPKPMKWEQLAAGEHAFDLVSFTGKVLAEVRGAAQDEYVLDSQSQGSGDHLFSAIFRHPDVTTGSLPPMKQLAIGSEIRVTGICILQYGTDPLGAPVAFDILLRSFDDVAVVGKPSWLTIRHLTYLSGLLVLFAIVAVIRGWILERRMRCQASALAAHIEMEAEVERRRSRILEEINARSPLSKTLELITALVSSRLNGASCWCETADGSRFGQPPAATEKHPIVEQAIRSHSGALIGRLLAVDRREADRARTSTALAMGAWLASLAIETRGLYSHLLHQSEFDLLTDVYNRFALDKVLEALIEEASGQARIFGLIYIDLDYFKEVNDQYGHLTGDLYLQQAALRMKGQLRPGDVLARLGGDEFAVLLPSTPGRPEIREIAHRLEHCFDQPFALGEVRVDGSASAGIAVYPEDGTTRDSLLNSADAAMYVAKNTKKAAHVLQHR